MTIHLFGDHKIARTAFNIAGELSQDEYMTRTFLGFLGQNHWITWTYDVERKALQVGRASSQLHYPQPHKQGQA